jgi:hypothetical protein
MQIRLDQFGGIAPKISDHLLPPQLATVARNCRFGSGALESWNAPFSVADLVKTGVSSLYRYIDAYWFHWAEDVDVVKAPVALDEFNRVYWTGEGYPRVGGDDVSIPGASLPLASYRMGVPAPSTAPSATVSGVIADIMAPTVLSITPVSNGSNVARNSKICATLSEDIDPTTATALTFTLTKAGVPVAGVVYSTRANILFDPVADLDSNTEYVATVTVGIEDLVGNPLEFAKTWEFTTGTTTDSTLPKVISSYPPSAATSIPITRSITATFDKPVDPTSVSGDSFYVKLGVVALTGTWSSAGNVITFAPDADLGVKQTYDVTITTDLKDLQGNYIASSVTWEFTTGYYADPVTPPTERVYVRTYVNGYGGEGPPSNPSNVVEVSDGDNVRVSLPTETLAGYNVVSQNIYRTERGSDSTEYLLVGNVAIGATSYDDGVQAETLTTILPSLTWDGPPDDMAGLVEHPMGSLVGFSGKEVLFSEPYRPHAWPYRYAVADPIVAIGVYGSYVLVTTTGKPYILSGSDPSAMSTDRLEKGEACVSKRGLVDMGPACIYPGPTGLWGAGLSDVSLLTEKILSLEQWKAYKPDSILGTHYDGDYIGFYDTGSVQGGFIFNPTTGDFNEIDTYATAAWNDTKTGRLYLVVDDAVVEWNGSTTPVSYTWRSRPYIAPSPSNVACAKVLADSYPVTFKVYADGALKHTQIVKNANPFWMPPCRAINWHAELLGTKKVNSVVMADNMADLQR